MTTDYDEIAEQYKRSKLQPWRTHIEAFTLMELVGNLHGQCVVDVACGEGFYTRMLRQRGATRVIGVDLSSAMIELARNEEARQPLGIEYRVGDGRDLRSSSDNDLVVAAYLLNYAKDRAELEAMCQGIASCLKPGGRLVTVNSSPQLDFSAAPSYRPYGFETCVRGECGEGSPITWAFFLDDGCFEVENYYLDAAIHDAAFRCAGFREVRWHPPRLSPDAEANPGRAFWKTFLEHSPIAFIECVK
jgi:toxoflavin synthase